MDLVDAQQARRILDRLVGYESARSFGRRSAAVYSAGRVQSVALRLIVEREREIEALSLKNTGPLKQTWCRKAVWCLYRAKLPKWTAKTPRLPLKTEVNAILEDMRKAVYTVDTIKHGIRRRNPSHRSSPVPHQQDASRSWDSLPGRRCPIAQQLYKAWN